MAVIVQPFVLEGVAALPQAEGGHLLLIGDALAQIHQPVSQVIYQCLVAMEYLNDRLQIGFELGLQRSRVVRGGLAEIHELHPVFLGKGSLGLPKEIAIDAVGRAVGDIVVLEVLAPLARPQPGDAGRPVRVVRAHHGQQGLRHRPPLAALLSAKDAPAMGGEPVHGRAIHNPADGVVVNAKVVPVHHIVEIVQGQTPGRVHRLMDRPRRQACLPLQDKDLDLARPSPLESQGRAGCRRAAVSRRTGVELEKKRLALHFGVAGEPPTPPKAQQVLPDQGPFRRLGHGVALVARLAVPDTQRLVEYGQGAVDQGDGVARPQDEAIAEALFGMADVPAHHAAEQSDQQSVHFGARAAGMTALPVVQDQVNELIDQVLGLFPVLKVGRQFLVSLLSVALHRFLLHGAGHLWNPVGPALVGPHGARPCPLPALSAC